MSSWALHAVTELVFEDAEDDETGKVVKKIRRNVLRLTVSEMHCLHKRVVCFPHHTSLILEAIHGLYCLLLCLLLALTKLL